MSNEYKEIWNKLHKEFASKHSIKYDKWLVEFDNIILETQLPIIDLGCGSTANNTMYLLEKAKKVISCDFSEEALNVVEKIKGSTTKKFDMLDGLPFEDNSSDIIIADLSLHYFKEQETFKILKEIIRVLTPKGYLFFRLNSTDSTEYKKLIEDNAKEIEFHLYFANDMEKRFFSKDDIDHYFAGWEIISLAQENMTRWTDDKIVWKGVVRVSE